MILSAGMVFYLLAKKLLSVQEDSHPPGTDTREDQEIGGTVCRAMIWGPL